MLPVLSGSSTMEMGVSKDQSGQLTPSLAYTAACSGDAALGVGTIDHVDEVDMRVLLPVGLASLANDALDHVVILQLKYVIGLQAAPEAKTTHLVVRHRHGRVKHVANLVERSAARSVVIGQIPDRIRTVL